MSLLHNHLFPASHASIVCNHPLVLPQHSFQKPTEKGCVGGRFFETFPAACAHPYSTSSVTGDSAGIRIPGWDVFLRTVEGSGRAESPAIGDFVAALSFPPWKPRGLHLCFQHSEISSLCFGRVSFTHCAQDSSPSHMVTTALQFREMFCNLP